MDPAVLGTPVVPATRASLSIPLALEARAAPAAPAVPAAPAIPLAPETPTQPALPALPARLYPSSPGTSDETRLTQQQLAFGYTSEELTVILRPMAEDGKEPVGSMGDDTALAVLSYQPRPLFHYFKQRFAEVTNPPIDHLRERLVFSLRTLLGARGQPLAERPEAAALIELPGPVLLGHEMRALQELSLRDERFRLVRLDAVFPVAEGPGELAPGVGAPSKSRGGRRGPGRRASWSSPTAASTRPTPPIPALMAVGAVHHHLIRAGKRMKASIIVESGEPREVHHFATAAGLRSVGGVPLSGAGYGGRLALQGGGPHPSRSPGALSPGGRGRPAQSDVQDGHLHLDGYIGGPDFEAVGLAGEVSRTCFPGTPSVVQGNGFRRHRRGGPGLAQQGVSRRREARNLRFLQAPQRRRAPRLHARDAPRKLHEAVVPGRPRRRQCRGHAPGRLRANGPRWCDAQPSQLPVGSGVSQRPLAPPAGRGGAGGGHRQALFHGANVARRAFARSPRGAGHRHEPAGRAFRLRRRRGGPRALWHRDATAP